MTIKAPANPEESSFVAAVSASTKHDFIKEGREDIVLLSGLGVVGDAHCGARVQHLYDMARDHAFTVAAIHEYVPNKILAVVLQLVLSPPQRIFIWLR